LGQHRQCPGEPVPTYAINSRWPAAADGADASGNPVSLSLMLLTLLTVLTVFSSVLRILPRPG